MVEKKINQSRWATVTIGDKFASSRQRQSQNGTNEGTEVWDRLSLIQCGCGLVRKRVGTKWTRGMENSKQWREEKCRDG